LNISVENHIIFFDVNIQSKYFRNVGLKNKYARGASKKELAGIP